jgi:hypothetical protein
VWSGNSGCAVISMEVTKEVYKYVDGTHG